jgi:hypothetical protein
MTHKTRGQKRALRELCALARTALEVCDMIADGGEESDDRPRLYLVTFERWTRGEETGAQLAARTRALNAWGASLTKGASRGETAWLIFKSALAWLVDAREDLMKNPGHNWHVGRVASHLASTLDALTGNGREAETHRVRLMLAKHTADVVRSWATAMREVSGARAKNDKTAAERALGTLPGME